MIRIGCQMGSNVGSKDCRLVALKVKDGERKRAFCNYREDHMQLWLQKAFLGGIPLGFP